MMTLVAGEIGGEQLAQLLKRINRARLDAGLPMSCHPFKGRGEGSIEDCIESLVE